MSPRKSLGFSLHKDLDKHWIVHVSYCTIQLMQNSAGCMVRCQMYILSLVLGQIIGIIKMLKFSRLRYMVLDCNL